MRKTTALVALVLGLTVALGLSATASARPAGESASEFTTRISNASLRSQFGRVWATVHPRYQRVVTRTFWEACKRKEANERAGMEVHSLKAIEQYPDTVVVPLLGRVKVTAVTMQMRYSHPLLGKNKTATDTVYVKKLAGQWKGLWDAETYQAYRAKRCPA